MNRFGRTRSSCQARRGSRAFRCICDAEMLYTMLTSTAAEKATCPRKFCLTIIASDARSRSIHTLSWLPTTRSPYSGYMCRRMLVLRHHGKFVIYNRYESSCVFVYYTSTHARSLLDVAFVHEKGKQCHVSQRLYNDRNVPCTCISSCKLLQHMMCAISLWTAHPDEVKALVGDLQCAIR